jgi:hypothetical protein
MLTVLTGLNLLLLLDHWLGAFGRYRRNEIIPLRQPQPRLRQRATRASRSLKGAAISSR